MSYSPKSVRVASYVFWPSLVVLAMWITNSAPNTWLRVVFRVFLLAIISTGAGVAFTVIEDLYRWKSHFDGAVGGGDTFQQVSLEIGQILAKSIVFSALAAAFLLFLAFKLPSLVGLELDYG